MVKDEFESLGLFDRYLTLWIFASMGIGLILGRLFPTLGPTLDSIKIAGISIPISLGLFFMLYPIMVKIKFSDILNVFNAPKPLLLTLLFNWAVKPFFVAALAYLFLRNYPQYMAGVILLGIAPCTASVLFWNHVAEGDDASGVLMVAVNSLMILILYPPLASVLLGVGDVPVPFLALASSVGVFVGLPMVLGYISKKELVKRKGEEWFETRYLIWTKDMGMIGLLGTLILLFSFKGELILTQPFIVLLISIPLVIEFFSIYGLAHYISWLKGLSYEEATPVSLISSSNNFEVAIAVAITVFGIDSGAAFATVVGPLIEVPIMLALVKISLRTKHIFKGGA